MNSTLVGSLGNFVAPAAGFDHLTRHVEEVHYVGVLQRMSRFHINDKRPAVRAHQVVRHTANSFSLNDPAQLKGLADYLSLRWIEVGKQESREFKSRLISHVRALRRAPIQAGIALLAQVPRKCPPRATGGDGFRIETFPVAGYTAAVGGFVKSFDEVSASLAHSLHAAPFRSPFIYVGDRFAARKVW
jgi:hypothetical protein